MKVILLAAGQGTRLRPITDDRPKCMTPLHGEPLISILLKRLKENGLSDVTLVGGYCFEVLCDFLRDEPITFVKNDNYDSSNMVVSFLKGLGDYRGPVLMSYTDICFESSILKTLLYSNHNISLACDPQWRALWNLRMNDPLSDAETFLWNDENRIFEIGQKPKSYEQIQAQYMGLVKFSKVGLDCFIQACENILAKDGLDALNKMSFTPLFQKMIESGEAIYGVPIQGKWCEVDTLSDLSAYENADFSF